MNVPYWFFLLGSFAIGWVAYDIYALIRGRGK